jgi:hypothetical protein
MANCISFLRSGPAALFLLLGLSQGARAQLIEQNKFFVTLEAALPSARSNAPYRQYLNGLISFQPKLQYKFAGDLYGAVGLRYQYSTISEFKVPEKMTGGEHVVGGYLEAGWSSWQTERFGVELGVKAGMGTHLFITDSTRITGQQNVNAFYLQPTLSLILASDEAVAYRWIIGYGIDYFNFQPSNLGIDTQGGFSDADLKKNSQSIIVGFAFSWYFGNKRSDEYIND